MPLLERLQEIGLQRHFWGNTLQTWVIALAVLIVVFFLLRVFKGLTARRATAWAQWSPLPWAPLVVDLLHGVRLWFLLMVAVYISSLLLVLPKRATQMLESVAAVTLLLQVALSGNVALAFFIVRYVKRQMETDAASATTISALGFVAKLALWSVIVLLMLANLGIEVTALVASLGIGGIAVALAAQNILSDLFASLSIVLDKPFVLGDFIIVGEQMGTVEKIGLKTSHLRSLSGEQLIFSNNDLLQSRIRNFKRMFERRALFTIGVTYQTPYEKLAAIPDMLRQIVQSQEMARLDRAHFKEYGDFALVFEVVYYVLKPDFSIYMDTQQAINLAIHKQFQEQQIEFAYPTQTVFLQQEKGNSTTCEASFED